MKSEADRLYLAFKRRAEVLAYEAREGHDWGSCFIVDPEVPLIRRSITGTRSPHELQWPIPAKGTTAEWLMRKYQRWLDRAEGQLDFKGGE